MNDMPADTYEAAVPDHPSSIHIEMTVEDAWELFWLKLGKLRDSRMHHSTSRPLPTRAELIMELDNLIMLLDKIPDNEDR